MHLVAQIYSLSLIDNHINHSISKAVKHRSGIQCCHMVLLFSEILEERKTGVCAEHVLIVRKLSRSIHFFNKNCQKNEICTCYRKNDCLCLQRKSECLTRYTTSKPKLI